MWDALKSEGSLCCLDWLRDLSASLDDSSCTSVPVNHSLTIQLQQQGNCGCWNGMPGKRAWSWDFSGLALAAEMAQKYPPPLLDLP